MKVENETCVLHGQFDGAALKADIFAYTSVQVFVLYNLQS